MVVVEPSFQQRVVAAVVESWLLSSVDVEEDDMAVGLVKVEGIVAFGGSIGRRAGVDCIEFDVEAPSKVDQISNSIIIPSSQSSIFPDPA